jgi:hypothetical protein
MLLCVTPVVAYAAEEEAEVAVEKTMTEEIVDYVTSHVEELSVIFTLILGIFYEVRKHGKLTGSIGTLNNNAIAVAQNSAVTVNTALAKAESIAEVVIEAKNEIAALLGEIRKGEEEKKALEDTISQTVGFLKTAKLAILELGNEVAELLVLANIPVSKKEELYSRHRAAVNAIAEAEGEVTTHDGEEA